MLEVKKTTKTNISVQITGESTINDEEVAWMTAHIDYDGNPVINMKIIDRDKYQDNYEAVEADERAFDAYVCESDNVPMTREEQITEVLNGNSDEPDGDDEPEDEDDKSGAGNEETIIP